GGQPCWRWSRSAWGGRPGGRGSGLPSRCVSLRCSLRVTCKHVISDVVTSARAAVQVVPLHQLTVDHLDEPRLGRVPWQAVGVEPTHQEGAGGVPSLFHGCGPGDDGNDAWRGSEQLHFPSPAAVVLGGEVGGRAGVQYHVGRDQRVVSGRLPATPVLRHGSTSSARRETATANGGRSAAGAWTG